MLYLIETIKNLYKRLNYFDDTDKNFEKKDAKLKSKYKRKIVFYLSNINDNEVLVSHDDTRKALDYVLNNNLKHVLIKTYSISDIGFYLSDPAYDHHYDIYIARLHDADTRPRYLKIYPHMKALTKDLRYCHNIRQLLMGGTFDKALSESDEKIEIEKNEFLFM